MSELTQEDLKKMLHYDENTGYFTWISAKNNRKPGGIAGSTDSYGYRQIYVINRLYLSHRLAFLYMIGRLPDNEVDHINGIRDDNRWANLREATKAQNACNRLFNKNNTSGYKGVSFHPSSKKWQANIRVGGKQRYLGLFNTPEFAYEAYKLAAIELHNKFANFGQSGR